MQTSLIAVRGLDVHYTEIAAVPDMSAPSTTHPTLVFLHGWGGTLASLYELASSIAPHSRKILIDIPGFGRSQIPPGTPQSAWGVGEYAKHIETFMELLHIQKPLLCGHSFGGALALYLAAHIQTTGLVVIAPSWKRDPVVGEGRGLFSELRSTVGQHIPLRIKKILYRILYPHSDFMHFPALAYHFKRIVRQDLSSSADAITIPTMIVWGVEDRATPVSHAHELKKHIAHAALELVTGAGHNLPIRSPDIVRDRVEPFLQSLTLPASHRK